LRYIEARHVVILKSYVELRTASCSNNSPPRVPSEISPITHMEEQERRYNNKAHYYSISSKSLFGNSGMSVSSDENVAPHYECQGHDVKTYIGVNMKKTAPAIKKAAPGYMPMGCTGMGEIGSMEMPLPDNTLPMMTGFAQFGPVKMGGMFSFVKVRPGLAADDYNDQGWYKHPEGTVATKGLAKCSPKPPAHLRRTAVCRRRNSAPSIRATTYRTLAKPRHPLASKSRQVHHARRHQVTMQIWTLI
jgi:hypothetical protein